MRVALVVERFEPGAGGVENVAQHAATGLARAGDEVHVIARRGEPAAGVSLRRVHVPAFWQPLRVARFSQAARRLTSAENFDIVYSLARTRHQDVYRAGGGSHASYLERRHPRGARALRLSPRHAAILRLEGGVFSDPRQRVVCNSEMVRGEIECRHGVAPRRLLVIQNGVDPARFRARSATERRAARVEKGGPDGPAWLFAGSGFARKGLDTALRALAASREPRAQLWVAGADAPNRWLRLAEALGVADRVRFLGYRRDLPDLYAATDALLLPTRYDACANTCLEAAACGVPVVTSAANGAAAALGDGAITVADAEDVCGFATALDRLSDAATRERLGIAAREATEPLTWDAHVTALRALFGQIRK